MTNDCPKAIGKLTLQTSAVQTAEMKPLQVKILLVHPEDQVHNVHNDQQLQICHNVSVQNGK